MIGFAPFETFRLLAETGGKERADMLLVAACQAFSRRHRHSPAEIAQFEELVDKLFLQTTTEAQQESIRAIKECDTIPKSVQLKASAGDGPATLAFIEQAPNLTDDILLKIVEDKRPKACAAIAARANISNLIMSKLFPINSRAIYRALAVNHSIRFAGPFLDAMIRAAKMDQSVAFSLVERPDFDNALLTDAFFNVPSSQRIGILEAHRGRSFPPTPLSRSYEQLSVVTGEFAQALMKLFSQNRRAEVTKLFAQITGLDEIRCGEIAHDVSGEALFVVLRAFGCTEADGLRVLIHAMSHEDFETKSLPIFSELFQTVSKDAMVYMLSVWRGEVPASSYTEPNYVPASGESNRTPEAAKIIVRPEVAQKLAKSA